MQGPLMGIIEGGADGESAEHRARRAWGLVADGYRAALAELCPTDPVFPRLQEALRLADRLARRPLVAVAEAPRHRRGTG